MTNKARDEKLFNVLLVEDEAAEILLMEEILQETGMNLHLRVVNDGEETMKYLHRVAPYADAAAPDLILLDLNMPRKNGFEVLAEIKQDPALLHIPVIILSNSQAEEDINRSYRLHANCFISKPSDLERFIEVMKSISLFWLRTAQLPSR